MYSLLVLCFVGVVVSMTVIDRSEVIEDQAWQVWKADHHKKYQDFGEEKVILLPQASLASVLTYVGMAFDRYNIPAG